MNPWLERPGLWRSIHTRLIVALADDLNTRLRPDHQAEVEESIFLATLDRSDLLGLPDVTVRTVAEAPAIYAAAGMGRPVVVELPYQHEIIHRWLAIRDIPANEVVAVVEILSPVNKRPGEGRDKYEARRNRTLQSSAHLIEIDLLRAGPAMPARWPGESPRGDYRILVSRARLRPRAELYPFDLRDSVPLFHLPLRTGADEPVIDVGRLLRELYDRANYDLSIDYARDPDPPLDAEALAWARQMLKEKERPGRVAPLGG
jgi:hypothetical protein